MSPEQPVIWKIKRPRVLQVACRDSLNPSHSQSSEDIAANGALPVVATGRGHFGWGGTKFRSIDRLGGGLPSSHDEPYYSPRNAAAEEQEDSFAEEFPSFSRQLVRRRSPPRSFLLSMPDGR